jgi:ABC-type polysaccharide/polyol phosphate transport system ATPase subunit
MVKGASTVVVVSHSFGLMTDICDRVVLIDKGEIAFVGEPQKAIKRYYDLEG